MSWCAKVLIGAFPVFFEYSRFAKHVFVKFFLCSKQLFTTFTFLINLIFVTTCFNDSFFLSNSAMVWPSFYELLYLWNVNSLELITCECLRGNFLINLPTENALIHKFVLNNASAEIRESRTVSIFLFCTVPLPPGTVMCFFVPFPQPFVHRQKKNWKALET